MRILHVNDVANVASTLVAGLNRIGHQAELRRLRLPASRRGTAAKILALPARWAEWTAVNRQVKSGHYDIVHIHYAYLGLLGILGQYPYILHCHGTDVRRGLYDPLRRGMVIQSLRRARKVLFSTPDLAQHVRPIRPDAIFLPNPIATDRFRPLPQGSNAPLRILIISRLSPIKKVSVAFEAIQQLRARHPEIQVAALDFGHERGKYHRAPGVSFLAPVPYTEMPELINAHDIVLGQFGLGIISMSELEAMACGKPVICHFTYGAWYPEPPPPFATDQPAQVAAYLEELVQDPALQRDRGEAGRAWVERYHGYLAVAQRLAEIYAELTAEKPTW